ncbi:MAG TPA: AidA/PixA family protein [Trinickia sp.]|uniref:AidA/PixA family protein n=1 Tax=Trinickia sp. TaxID=2571163 RepID=UPI002BF85E3A|nr:AidA/PixA family protein [Trinickia sp.]HTI17180.1 AidA/PixA family protein [Trinickia sp.]
MSDRFKPSIIDVAIMVDAPRIMFDYGPNKAQDRKTFSDFFNLGKGVGYVYMAATWWDSQNEGDSELDVFGVKGNTIRWRMQTLSMGGRADASLDSAAAPVAFQAVIRGFVFQGTQWSEFITKPTRKVETVKTWGFDADGNVVRQNITDVYWESQVITPGPVTYHTPFNIFCDSPNCSDGSDGSDDSGGGGGNGCGGYQHDPYINVNLNQ